jgi:hypothetical protein
LAIDKGGNLLALLGLATYLIRLPDEVDQKCEPFAANATLDLDESHDVTAQSAKRIDEFLTHRIADDRENDGNRGGLSI